MTTKEEKTIKAFLRWHYPIDTTIYDNTRGWIPLFIKKSSVFVVREENRAEEFKHDDENHNIVTAYVRNVGKNSPLYEIGWKPKGWWLVLAEKYLK